MKTYIIADTHFGDDLIRKCERQHFETVEAMNQAIIEAWNSVVSKDDLIYVLGDFAKQGSSFNTVAGLLECLNGRKRLVMGNHDDLSAEEYRSAGFEMVYDVPIILDGFWILSHKPLYVTEAMPYANIYADVHSNPNYKDVSTRGACVSVERTGYGPVLLDSIKQAVISSV